MEDILRYYQKWKIKINIEKTEQIIFTRNFTNNKILTPLKIRDVTIKDKATVKYLRIKFDKKLKYRDHIGDIKRKTDNIIRKLYSLIKRNSQLSTKNKLLLYTTVTRPVITYGAPVWGCISPTSLGKLQILQNKLLRLALNATKYTRIDTLHHVAQIHRLDQHIIQLASKFYEKTIYHENRLIKDITYIRQHKEITKKHPLPYQHLPIYLEQ